MRSTIISLFALSAPLVHAFSTYTPLRLQRRDICTDNNREVCDDSCMAPGSVCCNEGTGTYCPADTYCTADGCCPDGEFCVGGGGTSTVDLPFFTSSASDDDFFTSDDFFATTTTDDFVSTTEDAFASSSTDDDVFTSEESSSVEETSAAVPTETGEAESSSLRLSRTTVAPQTSAENTRGAPAETSTRAPPPAAGGAAGLAVAGLPGLVLVAGQLVMAL